MGWTTGRAFRELSMGLKSGPTTPTINVFSQFAAVQRTCSVRSKNREGWCKSPPSDVTKSP